MCQFEGWHNQHLSLRFKNHLPSSRQGEESPMPKGQRAREVLAQHLPNTSPQAALIGTTL